MSSLEKTKYEPIMAPSSSSSDLDVGEEAGFLSNEPSATRRSAQTRNLKLWVGTALNLVFFVISCVLFATWYYNTHLRLNAALRQASSYSPILDLLDLDMKVKTINGTLFPSKDGGSLARQMPNPESDALWSEYELTRYFPVTADQIRAMGKDPATVAKLEDEDWGLGDDAYVTILDVYHQMHCLNSLRQLAYPEYYGNGTHHHHDGGGGGKKKHGGRGRRPADMFAVHVNHCVDILMQAIQCSGNANLITMHWVETQPYPFPDMSVNRQCVDFDRLSAWRRAHTLYMDKYVATMRKRDDGSRRYTELPAPDQYYAHYLPGVPNPNHAGGAHPDEDFNL